MVGTVAYACAPIKTVVTLEPSASTAAGRSVTVRGFGFEEAPVEIRWNDVQGPQLGAATGPSFDAAVTIPSDATGLNTIVVVSRSGNGSLLNATTAAVQVKGGASAQSSEGRAEGDSGDDDTGSSVVLVLLAVVAGAVGGVLVSLLMRGRSQSPA
jgi:hypothetical protein